MRYGLFSDVHANTDAFRAVLESLKGERIDRYIFGGDIVGYGAEPKECIRLLRDLIETEGCICVAGNHDYAVCHKSNHDRYTRYAREAVEWTRTKLDQAEMDFLAGLELVSATEHLTVVHASLDDPAQWSYILDIDDAYPNFKFFQQVICFTGHSHKPIVFKADDNVDWSLDATFTLQPGAKYIVNIGSVGQPRDGNPRAAFAVYDTDSSTVEIKRVDYDIASAQKKIVDAGLPVWLAERLKIGK